MTEMLEPMEEVDNNDCDPPTVNEEFEKVLMNMKDGKST